MYASKVLLWATNRRIYIPLGSQFRAHWKLQPILQDINQVRRKIETLVIKRQHQKHGEAEKLAEMAAAGPTVTVWP